jgi:hypothetical protein
VVVRALAEALFAHPAGPTPQQLDVLIEDLDRFISPASKLRRIALLLMLALIHFAPLLLLKRIATFEALPLDQRVGLLERMAVSRVTAFALTLAAYKAILSLLFFEQDDELDALGYRSARRRHAPVVLQGQAAE